MSWKRWTLFLSPPAVFHKPEIKGLKEALQMKSVDSTACNICNERKLCNTVLVWAGVGLNFLTVVVMGLCFGFAENSVYNLEVFLSLLSSTCTASRPFLLPVLTHWWGGCRCMWHWERGTQQGQLTSSDQRDVLHHMASWSAYRAEEEGRGRC